MKPGTIQIIFVTMTLQEPKPPSRSILEAFITRHEHLLQLEREAEEEQTRLLNSNCSPKLLEQRGLAIGSLGVSSLSVGLGGKNLIELSRPLAYHTSTTLPPHTFRNGDPVRIEAHVTTKPKAKKEDDNAVEGVVYRVSAEKIVVAVDGSKEVDLPERLRLLKLANSVTFDRMARTLKHVRRIVCPESDPAHPTNIRLINVLLGIQQPQFGPVSELSWYGDKLNDSQKEAIKFCLSADSLACIHGPPGTGKTHTLVELIFQLLSRPASPETTLPPRILVCTPSNLALDNLLLRLHALSLLAPYSNLLPRDSILRLGHPTRVHRDLVRETLDYRAANGEQGELLKDVGNELQTNLSDLSKKRGEKGAVKGKERGKRWDEIRELRKEYRQREAKVVTTVVGAARVVLATCHSAGSRQLNNAMFDVCIIDEATQAVEAVCWVPVLKAKKLILAGDPQQLPPTIMSRKGDLPDMDKLDLGIGLKPPKTLETTLFDRLEKLYGPGIKRVLQVQYRMNEHIAAFPSKTLYESKLSSDPSVSTHTLLDLPSIVNPDEEETKDTLSPTVVFFDTAGCEFYERTEGDSKIEKGLGEGSKSNENEAELVAKYARKLVSLGVPAAEIAVVTPYQAQVSLIASMLRDEFPEMTIGSVDGLQGQEREAVILTLVRSNPTGEVGFLGEYRRLNVAMTRAKRQLCVVGDSATVAKGSKYLKSWMDWLEAEADVRWAGDDGL
ncbi:P-loop containing nucleoside triphosphate hydrolase protein [Naematelia encephala]|uniref:DNA helicase n=1 Tax=Naematelia encephala TaxID=71784 RepID=A0A1Y2AUS8_9TREE|nr:P-loop containing nucleoside triphosphate hydrolase protein [Naematelia encephala]